MIRIRLVRLFIFFLLFSGCVNIVYAAQTGSVQYTLPIDYSLIDEAQLSSEAESLFDAYCKSTDENQKKILLNKLLSNYSILSETDHENPLYATRLGIIYDKLKRDRWAKSYFFKSENLREDYPYSFYSFGNFFYDRKEYKKALYEYLKAYNTGYSTDYDTLCKIGAIYEKFGDFKSSVKYYKQALLYNDNADLRAKIIKLEELYEKNPLYDLQRKRGNLE